MNSVTGSVHDSDVSGVKPLDGNAIVRKVGRRLMWFLIALYVISVIDRANIGFASFSMNRELGLTAQMYSIGLGILFLGYSLFEVPSNLILARFGARVTLTRIAIAFGLVTTAMAFVKGPTSFYVVRGLLGVAEAGLTPGVFLFLSFWIPRSHRARYNAMFTYSIALAYILVSLVSSSILKLDGTFGLPGWKWMFILEGLPAVVLGLFGIVYLTDRPHQAKWLETHERNWLEAELATERSQSESTSLHTFGTVLRTPALWLMCFVYVGIFCGNACLTAWQPQILHANGVPLNRIGLVAAIPPLLGVIGMTFVCRSSDRRDERVMHGACACLVAAIGYGTVALSSSALAATAGFVVATIGVFSSLAIFWSIPQTFLPEQVKPAAIAFIASFGALLGGLLAPMGIGRIQTSTGNLAIGLIVVAVLFVVSALMTMVVGKIVVNRTKNPEL
ncbi:MFS transporter [Paraburkholderia sediminicola]|uniref:MFS transporter n=1 Tax=Paraburkholderia TaxID=1822464 RepID=UPI0038B7D134